MAVHSIRPAEDRAKRKVTRAKYPHRTVIEHAHKNGKPTGAHVIRHEYAAEDGTPMYGGPKNEDTVPVESKQAMLEHLAKALPGKPAEMGGGGDDEDDEA